MSDALLIAAHGSRDEAGVEEFWALADAWRRLRPDRLQGEGFLEFASPTIGRGIDDLVDRGASRIVVAPAMLMAAGHVKNGRAERGPGRPGATPGGADGDGQGPGHPPGVAGALPGPVSRGARRATRSRERSDPAPAGGAGTSDPDANANIARVSRFLWESTGVGWASVGFSGVTGPSVDEALAVCRRLGYERIVVQPYFLFDGVLLKRIGEVAARHAGADPGVEIVTTAHLRLHPLLLRAFEDRVHEAIHGSPDMNCGVCKYRVRLIGREADLGQPQVGHHLAVRAAEEADDHGHGPRRRRRASVAASQPGPAPVGDPTPHPWDDRLLARLELVGG